MLSPDPMDQLQTLRVTVDDIESQTGFTTNNFFIGGVLGGVYRLSVWRQPKHWLRIGGTELIALALTGMLAMPLGLVTLRDPHPAQTRRFVWVTASATTLMFAGWHIYLWYRARTLKVFMYLLDDIDQYNHLLETVIVLNRLGYINATTLSQDSTALLEALQTSRSSLITGLQLEVLMRRHRRLFNQSPTLWQDLDQALITLQSLDLQEQAQDYQAIINQALQISMSVQTTMQQYSLD